MIEAANKSCNRNRYCLTDAASCSTKTGRGMLLPRRHGVGSLLEVMTEVVLTDSPISGGGWARSVGGGDKYLRASVHELSFCPALFAFWLRSSVVSVLFSLISETSLRTFTRLFLFLKPVFEPLGLLMFKGTVSLVSHYLQLTRTIFHQFAGLSGLGLEKERVITATLFHTARGMCVQFWLRQVRPASPRWANESFRGRRVSHIRQRCRIESPMRQRMQV